MFGVEPNTCAQFTPFPQDPAQGILSAMGLEAVGPGAEGQGTSVASIADQRSGELDGGFILETLR